MTTFKPMLAHPVSKTIDWKNETYFIQPKLFELLFNILLSIIPQRSWSHIPDVVALESIAHGRSSSTLGFLEDSITHTSVYSGRPSHGAHPSWPCISKFEYHDMSMTPGRPQTMVYCDGTEITRERWNAWDHFMEITWLRLVHWDQFVEKTHHLLISEWNILLNAWNWLKKYQALEKWRSIAIHN